MKLTLHVCARMSAMSIFLSPISHTLCSFYYCLRSLTRVNTETNGVSFCENLESRTLIITGLVSLVRERKNPRVYTHRGRACLVSFILYPDAKSCCQTLINSQLNRTVDMHYTFPFCLSCAKSMCASMSSPM